MSKQRIVVTGLGVISGGGSSISAFKETLVKGKSCMGYVTGFDTTGFNEVIAGEIKEPNLDPYIQNLNPKNIGRSSKLAIFASHMALKDAGIDTSTDLMGKTVSVCIGTTDGESQALDSLAKTWATSSINDFDGKLVQQTSTSNISNNVSKEFSFTGQSTVFSTACSAGNYATGYAFDLLMNKDADIVLCGGSDSLCRKTYAGFLRLGTIAPGDCTPFDLNRKGILIGEGSGILVLETLESAEKRGAKIYAEMLGYGLNCDANHMVSPSSESIENCIRLAHKNSGIDSCDVDYICAHGTGTLANDKTESTAIISAFDGDPPPVSSIKSMIGHTMGAASAIANIACILAIKHSFLPPTINHTTNDKECIPDCIPNISRKSEVSIVQNNGFAFGGNNAITIFSKLKQG